MSRWTKWSLATLAGLGLAAPSVATGQAQSASTLAVLPFEDGGSHGRPDEEFAGLRRGIAALLAAEIGRYATVRVVDRDQIAQALKAEGLTEAPRLDAATATRVAQAAGATLVVAGTFIDLYGDVRLDARLLDARTGAVQKVVRSDPKLTERGQLFRIIQSVAERIVEAGGLGQVTAAGREAARTRNPTTEAITDYGRGLLYLDLGQTARAEEYLGKAGDLAEARAALRGLRARG